MQYEHSAVPVPKVAYIATYSGRDFSSGCKRTAIEGYTGELTSALQRLGAPLHILARHEEDDAEQEQPFVTRAWHRRKPWEIVVAAARTRARLIHVQHELFMYGSTVSAFVAPYLFRVIRLFRKKVVVTIHGVVRPSDITHEFCKRNNYGLIPPKLVRWAFRTIYGQLCRSSDAVVVHDEEFRDRLLRQWGLKVRVEVIPHWLPVLPEALPREQCLKRFELAPGKRFVSFFGFVSSYKGVSQLLDAWEDLRRRRTDIELLVAGGMNGQHAADPRYIKEYDALVSRASTISGVKWLGFVDGDDLGHLFGAIDLVVLPYTELLAISGPLCVAASYNKPVLASHILSPILPPDIPITRLEPSALSQAIEAALETAAPETFAVWREQRTPSCAAATHLKLYDDLLQCRVAM